MQEIKGITLSKGYAKGKAQYISDAMDYKVATKIFKKGNILVTPILFPEFNPVFYKAKGVVCAVSSITSHPAIIARELGIPCIGGIDTKALFKQLKKLDEIIVDANNSKIYIHSNKHMTSSKNIITKVVFKKSKEYISDEKEIINLIESLDYKQLEKKLSSTIKVMNNNFNLFLTTSNNTKLVIAKTYFYNLSNLIKDKFVVLLEKKGYKHSDLLDMLSKIDRNKKAVNNIEKMYRVLRKEIQELDRNATINNKHIWDYK